MSFTLNMPKLSPTMEEGVIAKWHKKVGDLVEPGELILEVATDKATVEYNAIDGGYLRKILVGEGQEAKVNDPIALLTETLEEAIAEPKVGEATEKAEVVKAPEPVKTETKTPSVPQALSEGRIKASPLAKKLAKERGIDLSAVRGTGPGGRIVSRDLLQTKAETKVLASHELTLTPMRKVIAKKLQEVKSTVPHFYVTLEVDAEPLVEIREQLSRLERKVSFNDLVVKAVALALLEHPEVNSGFNEKNQTILRYGAVDISVAVSIPEGLITPIVFKADTKSVEEISENIRSLAKKAKEGKLQPAEFQGGSFTISNLGMFGVSTFQAIINPPQAAILAVSAILDKPVVKGGQVVPGKLLSLTLSVDHRVIDGVAAAKFLKSVQYLLENPAALI